MISSQSACFLPAVGVFDAEEYFAEVIEEVSPGLNDFLREDILFSVHPKIREC
jgi:hypothetical protein